VSRSYFTGKTAPLRSCRTQRGERVLITGGSGFIGTNLIEYYINEPAFEVLSVDNAPPQNHDHANCHFQADIVNFSEVDRIVRAFRPTAIFHLAARTDLDGASQNDYAVNTVGTENLIHAIHELSLKPDITIFTSSQLVCRIGYVPQVETDYAPNTAYGQSKVRTEQLIRALAREHFTWLIVRPTSIWGPWCGVPYLNFFEAVSHIYAHPKGYRIRKSFGFVGNTVHQLDRLAYGQVDAIRFKTLYICDYSPLEVRNWARCIAHCFGRHPPLDLPVLLLYICAKVGDFVENISSFKAPLTSFRLSNLLTDTAYVSEKLQKTVGALPFTMEEGVEITARWMMAR
jgi:nucleoside-diphosphate-sugar epimerase